MDDPLQLTLSQPGGEGEDYAHQSTMGLVWLKFALGPLGLLAT